MNNGRGSKLADNSAYSLQLGAWRSGQEDVVDNRIIYKGRPQRYIGRSAIEDRLAKILSQLGLRFKRNQYIGGYEVDFLIEDLKLVIEANGKWYHTPQKDSRKANALYALGYRVIQARGTDIMNRPKKVMEDIKIKIRMRGLAA